MVVGVAASLIMICQARLIYLKCLLLQHGLLAGGLADGSVVLWDPASILTPQQGRSPSLAKMQKHTGAVSSMHMYVCNGRYLPL